MAVALTLVLAAASSASRRAFAQSTRTDARILVPRTLASYHHSQWGEAEGIPGSAVSSLARTPDGYLWLGTARALVRFDGVRLRALDGSTSPALRSTVAGPYRVLLVDGEGSLWAQRADSALVRYRHGEFTAAAASRRAWAQALTDGRGRSWLREEGTGTLYALDPSGRLTRAELPPPVPTQGVVEIARESTGGLWIGTDDGAVWRVGRGPPTRLPSPPTGTDRRVAPKLQSRDGRVWVTTSRGLFRWDGARWERIPAPPGAIVRDVRVLREDGEGVVWASGGGDGIRRWSGRAFERYTAALGLSTDLVDDLLVDHEGTVWAASRGGLDRLRPSAFATLNRGQRLPFRTATVVLATPEGTPCDANQDAAWTCLQFAGTVAPDIAPGASPSSAGTLFRFGAPAPSGGAWLIGQGARPGILRDDGRVRERYAPDRRWPSREIREIHDDGRGALWVAFAPRGFGRLLRRPKGDGRLTRIPLAASGEEPAVHAIAHDALGRIWVALGGPSPGLVQLAPDGRVLRRVPAAGRADSVTDLAVTSHDTVWTMTFGGALDRVVAARTASALTEREVDSLVGPYARILLDAAGGAWLAGMNGIARLPREFLDSRADGARLPVVARRFDGADGLPTPRLVGRSRPNASGGVDSRLWFGTPAGLATVDPLVIPANPVAPLVHVEELLVGGTPTPGVWPRRNATPRLAPRPARVTIRFAVTALRIPERVRVRYRLDGSDTEWQDAAPLVREASYTGLAPGRYTFRVMAANEDGIWNRGAIPLSFVVTPAWHQTWWALALLLAAVAGGSGALATLVARARRRRLTARYDAALAERERIAQELHDTLLQDFTALTLQLHIIARRIVSAPAAAAAALEPLLGVANATLRDARHAVWDLRAPELVRAGLPAALERAVREAASRQSVDLRFTVAGTPRPLTHPQEVALFRIGREAVSNALQHADPTAIEVHLRYDGREVTLNVRDFGRGLDPTRAERATSEGHWGLQGMRERVARLGGHLEIDSEHGRGTTLTVRLPVDA